METARGLARRAPGATRRRRSDPALAPRLVLIDRWISDTLPPMIHRPVRRLLATALFSSLPLVLAPGCASTTARTTTETVQRPGPRPDTVERETTTTTTETPRPGGILSGTVDLLGEILSLPFRIVGGLIRIIF